MNRKRNHRRSHMHNFRRTAKSATVAVALELLPGFFLQTFGIGNIYAGNVALGLCLMFGYWILAVVNFYYIFSLIGFLTFPICWLIMLILSPLLASATARQSRY